ncbi:MAG: rhomboid family intramembrane serine protease [Planctomycetaceae bacterium]
MGLEDRDYLREERRSVAFGPPGGGWAIKYLLIANVLVFLAQQTSPLVTMWLDLRLPDGILSDGVPFYTVGDSLDDVKVNFAVGRLELDGPDRRRLGDLGQPDRVLDGGARVFVVGKEGPVALVYQGGEYGVVPAAEVGLAPGRFWELLWRLVTYGFCHSTQGLMHIVFNMLVLWMFGRSIEPLLGSREFLAFYLAAIVISGLCHLVVQAFEPVPVLGASGGVMAVVFLTAMYYPRMTVLLFFVVPVELRWVAVLYAVIDVAGLFSDNPTVAHAAHLGGAAFGVAYKHYGWRLMPWISGFRVLLKSRRPSRPPRVRIHRPSPDEVRARVDDLLDKIHRQGEASLTDEERQFLRDASREYRHR